MNHSGLNIEGFASATNTVGAGRHFKGLGVHVNQGFNIPGFGTSRSRIGLANRYAPGVGYLGSCGHNVPGATNGSNIATGFLNPIAKPTKILGRSPVKHPSIAKTSNEEDLKQILQSFHDELSSKK